MLHLFCATNSLLTLHVCHDMYRQFLNPVVCASESGFCSCTAASPRNHPRVGHHWRCRAVPSAVSGALAQKRQRAGNEVSC